MIKKRKTLSAVCFLMAFVMAGSMLLSAVGGAMAVTQAEIDSLKQQQEEINNKKNELKGKISGLEDTLEAAVAEKENLDRQNELTRQEIELINEQIALYESLVEQKAQELEEAIAAEEEQKEELRIRMRKMEETGKLSYISILFNATSFSDLLSRLDSVNMIMKRDKAVEEAYIAAREHVEVVKAEYEETLAECEATKAELEEKKAELERQVAAAEDIIKKLEEDIEKEWALFGSLSSEGAALEESINQKIAELEKQQQENGIVMVGGTGTYIWPLSGGPSVYPPGSAYGWRIHPIYGERRFHYGEDIGAPLGTPILAADSGTVAIATFGGGYGNYVVLSHGGGRTTLYGHMSSIAVSVGQSVGQGDVIGYVGSTGISTGPHVHFETRTNGVTSDPKSYFGLA